MPRMPGYERQIGIPRSPGGAMADGRGSAAVANAVGNLADSVQRVGMLHAQIDRQQVEDTARKDRELQALIDRKTTEDARAWTVDAISNDAIGWTEWMRSAKDKAPPGATGFARDFLTTFDDQHAKALEAAPPEAKQFYSDRRQALRVRLHQDAVDFEAVAGARNREAKIDAAVNRAEALAVTDPDAAKTLIAETEAALRDAPSADLYGPKLRAMRERVTRAAAQGLVERDPRGALRVLDRYFGVDPAARQQAGAWGMDALFGAVVQQESGGVHANAAGVLTTSPKGAEGASQLMPATAADPGFGIAPVKDRSEAEYLRVGRELLGALVREYGGDQVKALAAYNWGQKRVDNAVRTWGGDWLSHAPAETRDYVARISAKLGPQPSATPAPTVPSGQPSGEWFVDVLDPQAAVVLRNRAETDVRRMDAEKHARATLEAQAAQEQAKGILAMMRDGYSPNPRDLAAVRMAVQGTTTGRQLDEAGEDLAYAAQFRVMPAAQRTAALDAMRARSEWTPRQAAVFDNLSKLDAKITAEFKADPLKAGTTQGLYADVAPLDTTSMQTIVGSLDRRLAQVQLVERRDGRAHSPFTDAEGDKVLAHLRAMQPADQSQAVAVLAEKLGSDRAVRAATQFDGKDKPLALAFALAGQRTADGRNASELVLRGARALADKAVKEDKAAVTGWEASIAREVDALGLPNAQIAGNLKAAALFAVAARAAEKGGVFDGNFGGAVARVAGGQIVEHGDGKVILPPGMSEDDFGRRLRAVTPSSLSDQATPGPDGKGLVRVAGAYVPLESFVRMLPQATLVNRGGAQFSVMAGPTPETRRFVTDLNGRPIVIDLAPQFVGPQP